MRRAIEAWNENDWEALQKLWDPEGEIVPPEGWPETGARTGWPAIREQFRVIKDSWSEDRVEAISIEQVGDRALTHVHWAVRGEASGAPLQVEMWMLFEFGNGLISRIQYFLEREAASSAMAKGAS